LPERIRKGSLRVRKEPGEAKETSVMKQLQEHKWLAIVGGVAILLSAGAIAWAAVAWSVAKDDTPDRDRIATRLSQTDALGATPGATAPPAGMMGGGKDRRGTVQDLRERGIERLVGILDRVRDQMSPEDQEQYDALMEALKDQRDSLREEGQGLADTLKELRALVAKYVGVDEGAAE
jgi:hypothetical protein